MDGDTGPFGQAPDGACASPGSLALVLALLKHMTEHLGKCLGVCLVEAGDGDA